MNEHQKRVIKALEVMKGDDTARARAAFRNFTPEKMHQPYGENEKTPAQILADYERDDAEVDAAIEWVKNAIYLKESEQAKTEGAFYADILQHRIEYNFSDSDAPVELDESSVEHLEKCIKEGYGSGELCVLGNDGDTEYRGWWKIVSK